MRAWHGVKLMVGAASVLAGCATAQAPDEPGAGATGASTTPPITADAVTPAASGSPSELPTVEVVAEEPAEPSVPQAAAPSLADIEGRWCLAEPRLREDECIAIALPLVLVEGAPQAEYVYVDGDDPRGRTAADFAVAPDSEECWTAAVDVYPPSGGAMLVYCPAGAESGDPGIDEPRHLEGAFLGVDVADILAMDRLYLTQEGDPYPYLRTDS